MLKQLKGWKLVLEKDGWDSDSEDKEDEEKVTLMVDVNNVNVIIVPARMNTAPKKVIMWP